ncbi:hypothetical protein [Schnuerera sp.]|uniref:hypothetical protein n=1 Tax=Schnuerera sp. TaxID=2794844 RepID=UPI002CECE23D|nr:hypothetical protein [Schnuerera sp.]HSH35237.1 hypothetical protein [Schnuerera sp.]
MNAQEAYNQLKDIPEDQFIKSHFGKDGKCCAIGHLVRIALNPDEINNQTCSDELGGFIYGNPVKDPEKQKKVKEINDFARRRVEEFIEDKYGLSYINLAEINNYPRTNDYTQKSIKKRVLACLKDMIEWENDQQ